MKRRDDIDFAHSRAILLGTSTYTAGFDDRTPMVAARNSLAEMLDALTGPCEWPKKRVSVFTDEQDAGQLLRVISKQIRDVTDVLVFYYVGHGQPLAHNGHYDLGLALTDTSEEPEQRDLTSLRFRDLREQIERRSKARIKIIILDCCCSGIATRYADSAARLTEHAQNANSQRGAGTYIWTACGHTQETYFEDTPRGLTYFTRFLTEALYDTGDARPPGATVAELYDQVKLRLAEAELPEAVTPPRPDLYYSGSPDQFVFVRGQAPEFRFEPLRAGEPRKVGPYQIEARLGDGGAGQVFLAFTPDRRALAIKLLRPEFGHDREFAIRFAREIKISGRVAGPRVAELIDSDPKAPRPWLASAYVCGPSLLDLVKESPPLPTDDILRIAAGIAQGLAAMHAIGIIHRDLKPANVMLDATGPKIIDFGIVKSITDTLMTRTNIQLGTPAYRSPEQVAGLKVITAKSDVFTLGATIYYLATGEDAFATEDPFGIMNLIRDAQPDLSVLDEPVRGLVESCLAKDPDQRPTAAQLAETCIALLGPIDPDAPLTIDRAAASIKARTDALTALTPPAEPTVEQPPVEAPPPPPQEPPWQPPGGTGPTQDFLPPERNQAAQRARGLVVGLVVAAICLAFALVPSLSTHNNSTNSGGGSSAPSTTYSAPYQPQPYVPPIVPDPPTTGTTTDAPDLFQQAQVGSCFVNDGSYAQPSLKTTDCANAGVFTVVQILDGTSDSSGCDVAPDDYNVNNVADDIVLCLRYGRTDGAYNAQVNDCVFGPNQPDIAWNIEPCQTGNFKVRERLKGTTDTSQCDNFDENFVIRTAWPNLDVLLCLNIIYPDAAGRARVNSCLSRTSNGTSVVFQAVPCDAANVVVTGRTGVFDDPAFCGQDGATWWEPTGFPSLGYTVCWRRI